jgi:hypothetical protein
LGRGGCQNRWQLLVSCDHGDSITMIISTSGLGATEAVVDTRVMIIFRWGAPCRVRFETV